MCCITSILVKSTLEYQTKRDQWSTKKKQLKREVLTTIPSNSDSKDERDFNLRGINI